MYKLSYSKIFICIFLIILTMNSAYAHVFRVRERINVYGQDFFPGDYVNLQLQDNNYYYTSSLDSAEKVPKSSVIPLDETHFVPPLQGTANISSILYNDEIDANKAVNRSVVPSGYFVKKG